MKTYVNNGIKTEIKCNGGKCETKTTPINNSKPSTPAKQTISR